MNYILPEDFDFYKELNKSIKNTDDDNFENKCLISNNELNKEYTIVLDCGHKFNYLDLFNDLQQYKCNDSNYNVNKLYDYQMRCPYCRQIQNSILPYYPEILKNKIRGVNYPLHYSMGNNLCNYKFKSGKKKGELCNKCCYRDKCHLHFKCNENAICIKNVPRTYEKLIKITVPELKKLCKELNIKNYSKLKKNDLINKLLNN